MKLSCWIFIWHYQLCKWLVVAPTNTPNRSTGPWPTQVSHSLLGGYEQKIRNGHSLPILFFIYAWGSKHCISISHTLAKLYQTAEVVIIGVTDGNLICFAFVSYLFLEYCKFLTIMKQALFRPSCHT